MRDLATRHEERGLVTESRPTFIRVAEREHGVDEGVPERSSAEVAIAKIVSGPMVPAQCDGAATDAWSTAAGSLSAAHLVGHFLPRR
jgi:hypothetical protein